MFYVAVDIGCLECGESSAVLGIFTDLKRAEAICTKMSNEQEANWHGEHRFRVFEISELNVAYEVDY